MQPEATPQRRTVVLAGVVTLAGAGTLAACGSSGTSGSATTTASAPAGGTPSSSGASPSASGGAAADSTVKLTDVPVGGAVTAAGGTVIVAQPTAGQFVGYRAICPHAGCKVTPAGAQLRCPCHGSTFELATGKVLRGPAKEDLSPVPVKVSGQDVVAG